MIDTLFGIGAIILWLAVILFLLVPKLTNRAKNLLRNSNKQVFIVVFALSLIAMLGSLTYSDIIGFEPCRLCWYQRIFMYPIVLLSFMAMIYEDTKALIYIKSLALIGGLIAIFHIIEQRLPNTGLSCGSVGQAVSCDSLWVNAFGLVTIPTMSFTIFLSIITVIYLYNSAVIHEE